MYDVIYCKKPLWLKLYIIKNIKKKTHIFFNEYAIYFILWSEKMYISIVALPLMKYAFFASQWNKWHVSSKKFEYPLCI